MEQLVLPLKLQGENNLENFISGLNEEIVTVLKNIFIDPQDTSIYLWGQSGLGKSHLLQGVCIDALQKHKQAFYLDLEEHDILHPSIFQDLANFDLIAMDNLHKIAGIFFWEEAFFHLYNEMKKQGRILLMAARDLPMRIPWILPDLRSRLEWGLIYQLHELTDHEKILALTIHAEKKGIRINEDVWCYIVRKFPRDMPTLLHILARLEKQSLIHQKKITIPFVRYTFQLS